MGEVQSWRELLGKIIQDPQERRRIANELGLNPATLVRWAQNETNPRPQFLHQLLEIVPQQRSELLELISEEFPEFIGTMKEDLVEDKLKEIPSTFYTSVLNVLVKTPEQLKFQTLCSLILQQALNQLDPDRKGMQLMLVQCVPPHHGNKIRSLCVTMGQGTPPWESGLERYAMFLGIESLAGYAVTSGRLLSIQNKSESEKFLPARWLDWEESSIACPITHLNKVAGCLLASSAQPNYFLRAHEVLLQNYANLLTLALQPEEFYKPQDISLQVMPEHDVQKAFLSNFRQRVISVMRDAVGKQQLLDTFEAELLVWQQLEDELLGLRLLERVEE